MKKHRRATVADLLAEKGKRQLTMPASAAGTIFAEKLPVAADASLIRPIVSRHLGVLRNAGAIHGAIAALLPLAEGNSPAADPAIVALSIAVFASLRTESRGAHG